MPGFLREVMASHDRSVIGIDPVHQRGKSGQRREKHESHRGPPFASIDDPDDEPDCETGNDRRRDGVFFIHAGIVAGEAGTGRRAAL